MLGDWVVPPVSTAGQHYIDGAIGSATSAALLVDEGVDTACVVAPMAAAPLHRPWSPLTRAEQLVRLVVPRSLEAEVATLCNAGITTTVLAPCSEA